MHLWDKLLLLIAASFTLSLASSKEVDYCSVPSCKPRKHVMCEFPKPGGDAECGVGHKPQPLTEQQKTDLLDWHNRVRSGVALSTSSIVPGGGFDRPVSNMLEMTWSKELERFAQRWADQCNVAVQREHDQCRNTMLSDTKADVGQLVYIYKFSTESDTGASALNKLKQEWTQEPLAMPEGDEKLSGPREWVLQVAWPAASTLGCAKSQFAGTVTVVCNYGVAVGRSSDGPLFGSTCTDCPPPKVCSITWPALCLSPRPPSVASTFGPALVPLVLALLVAGTFGQGLIG